MYVQLRAFVVFHFYIQNSLFLVRYSCEGVRMWKFENESITVVRGNFFSLRPHKKGVKKIGLEGVKKENSCSAVRYYYLLVSRTTERFYS